MINLLELKKNLETLEKKLEKLDFILSDLVFVLSTTDKSVDKQEEIEKIHEQCSGIDARPIIQGILNKYGYSSKRES